MQTAASERVSSVQAECVRRLGRTTARTIGAASESTAASMEGQLLQWLLFSGTPRALIRAVATMLALEHLWAVH